MGFYNKSEGRYRLYTDAQRKQYGEEKREQRRNEWHSTWITKTRLKQEKNWTDKAIADFLPEPETAGQGRRGPIKAYRRELVFKVEKTKAFKEWMEKRVQTQSARKQKSDP
ncbi:hypothetical protein P3447_09660 [Vibrio parahaemolyticus]|nr:hypothetical protein [Vibrio parahaemolyticus]